MTLQWFRDEEVIGLMKPADVVARLQDIGELDLARAMSQPQLHGARLQDFSFEGFFGGTPPWMHAAHVFGFLPSGGGAIVAPGAVTADESLRNGRINVTLNKLRIAKYPGRGRRQILFDCSGQNQLSTGCEDAHFNMMVRCNDDDMIGILNYPIFVGLHVGTGGTLFRCYTVNVQNEQDERLLAVLDSEVFKRGLKLASVAQPALGPLSEMALGVTRAVASRNRNVPVQNIQIGLDFGGPSLGARLAQGDYIAVQVPLEALKDWDWNDYAFNPRVGEIVHESDGTPIPYNYIAFGISAYRGAND